MTLEDKNLHYMEMVVQEAFVSWQQDEPLSQVLFEYLSAHHVLLHSEDISQRDIVDALCAFNAQGIDKSLTSALNEAKNSPDSVLSVLEKIDQGHGKILSKFFISYGFNVQI